MFLMSFLAATTLVTRAICAPLQLHDRQTSDGIPDYVLKYAPILYLHTGEQYFPTSLHTFLNNTTPRAPFNEVTDRPQPLTLFNLNKLGKDVYLTSNDDVTQNPTWIKGTVPDETGKTQNAITAAVIVNDKGNGTVDAFYMYFYAYNYGGEVLGWDKLNFGNHVGDWEHNMIRFQSGVPEAIWYSQHANGQAFKYRTVEKLDSRPVVYVSKGSHANYAMPGVHDHLIPNLNLPGGALQDYTDRGAKWDPLLSAYSYKFDAGVESFAPYDAGVPVEWLDFRGRWGDKEYPTGDERQVKLFGQAKFGDGPTGPVDKQLNRDRICPENGDLCIVRNILVP